MAADRIIGRDAERSKLELAIGPGSDGLRLAMLTGPSGRGKTTLLGDAVERASANGFRIARANARAGALTTPFAPWREALPHFGTILDAMGEGAKADIEQIGVRLVETLAELTVDAPVLLTFDDAQALDESSLALLPYAAGVSEQMNLTLMLVEQTDAVGVSDSYRAFRDGILARRVVGHVELGPLADDAIAEIVGMELDLPEGSEVPIDIVLRAEGNPWFAIELANAHRRGDKELPTNIAAAATSRLYSLDEKAQDLVYAIAICPEGAQIGWLEVLAEQKPRDFARTMEAIEHSGLTREDGEFISIAHPLMQEAVIGELSAAMRRAIHVEMVDAIDATPLDDVIVARAKGYHLAAAGKRDDAIAQFVAAAEANKMVGKLHEAAADYGRALASEVRESERTELLRTAAFVAMDIGSPQAPRYWADLARLASATRNDELEAFALFQQYWASDDGVAQDRLQRAAILGPDRIGWSARAAGLMCALEGDYQAQLAHELRAYEIAVERDDLLLQALSAEKVGFAFAHLGNINDAIGWVRKARDICTRNRYQDWALEAWSALTDAMVWNMSPDEACSEAAAAVRYADDTDSYRFRIWSRASMASTLQRVGKVSEARAVLDELSMSPAEAGSNRYYHVFVELIRAITLVDSGELQSAGEALESASAAVERAGVSPLINELAFARAQYLVNTGKVAEAAAMLSQITDWDSMLLSDLALWAVRTGVRLNEGSFLAFAAESLASADQSSPLGEMKFREVKVTLDALDTRSVDQVYEMARLWERDGFRLDAARCLVVAGILDSRQGGRDKAVASLTKAKRDMTELGAGADVDHISSLLRSLGSRSRASSRSTQVGTLTKRELEIARLVAEGLKNSEVAERLFLAEKTVAAHLSNIYGKVEVKSRVQLTAWLRENDQQVSATA